MISGCQIYGFIGSVASLVSINTLAAIAVDRCLVIVRTIPSQNRPSRRYLYMSLGFIWIYAASWASVPLAGWGKYILEGTEASCTFDFLTRDTNTISHVTSICTVHFFIPVTLISFSYYLIFKSVRKTQREISHIARVFTTEEVPLHVQNQCMGMNRELKTAKVSLIIILVFCISWSPYAIVALIGVFGDQTLVTRLGSGIPCLCAKFSTVMNPLLYALLHPKFRKRLCKIRTNRNIREYELKAVGRRQSMSRCNSSSLEF